ncbi:hypothetical protein RB653_004273 [Dictyostelium firmibasis]|uniref:CCAAT-binding factor domain-containing protein n=1 Tax=Dictyostelium firmibasis TaxID=79012 RepID=A0AAN7U9G6_9MYCE
MVVPTQSKTTTTTTTTTATAEKPKTSEKPNNKKSDNKKQDKKNSNEDKKINNKEKYHNKSNKTEEVNNKKFTSPKTNNNDKKDVTKAESSRDRFSKKFFGNKDKKETEVTPTLSSFQKREQPYQKKETTQPYQKKETTQPYQKKETTQPYQKKFEIKKDNPTPNKESDIKVQTIDQTLAKAQGLYNNKVEEYLTEFKKSGSRDDQWKEKIQHTGTIRDRISAISLLIQKAPMYRLASLDILLNLAAKKSEREREFAINSLKDLFVNSLLPNTKLKRFNERENIKNSKPVELVQWYFEDLLKARYQAYIRLLEILSKDTVPRIRSIATSTVQYLLLKKPEQEEVLLALLVNKLGDEEGGNASKAVKLLEKLLETHPAMKIVVIREIELFLYRPNNSNRAQYNALYYLNKLQVACDKDGTSSVEIKEMSHRLIKLYFTFFTNKSNINSSAISLIIFGIRKAYSITKETTVFEPEQLKSLFKSCRKSTLNKVIQTLCLIFEIKQHTPEIANEFYSNLYHTLNRTEKLSQFDQTSFLNLVFRGIKHDDNLSRSMAILKRLLQFSFHQIVSFSAATLILVSELIKFNPAFGTMITDVKESLSSPKGESEDESEEEQEETYNPYHHDPIKANAQLSCLWEITLYSIHQHPSISSMANDLLNSKPIKFQGNPTVLFTLSAFLEKFVLSRQKNRKLMTTLKVTKSKIAEQYGINSDEEDANQDEEEGDEEEEEEEEQVGEIRPEDKFLKTFGDISTASGITNKKKVGIQFVTNDEEVDKALGYKENENDSDEDLEDLDAEYSYEDLEDSDFEDEVFETEIPKSKKPVAQPTKKSTDQAEDENDDDDEEFDVDDEEFASLNNEEFLDSIPDDDDEEDNGEDLDEDEEDEEYMGDVDEEQDDDDDDEDATNVDTPDFGDEEADEDVDGDDDVQTPDFGDEDEEDEQDEGDEDDEDKSDFLKSMQNNDAFMDADDFASMLEKSGGSNNKSSFKKKGSKSIAPSKKSSTSKQPKKSSSAKRKRF